MLHELDAPRAGSRACRFVERLDLARLRRSGRSSPRSSCRSPAAPSPCRRARAARPSAPSRASRCGRPAVGEHAERLARPRAPSRSARSSSCSATSAFRGKRLRHRQRSYGSVPGADRLPPDLQRAREPRADGARRSRRAQARRRVLVIDDSSPDGTGELADRLAAELAVRRRAPPAAQGGPRARLPRRLPARARRRRRARARDGLRLLARPGATCRA